MKMMSLKTIGRRIAETFQFLMKIVTEKKKKKKNLA